MSEMPIPMPVPSPYLDDNESEGSILREFVDSQEVRPGTPPLGHLTPSSSARRTGETGPSKRQLHRSQKTRREPVTPDTPKEDLIRILMTQKKDYHHVQRALRLASERIDADAQRAEYNNTQTIEQFRVLNESRLAAQQEAVKANSELRLYQFQLENTKKEMARTQEALKAAEEQRNEAEAEAQRARAKARKYLQERAVAAAKEEGRRLGFEAGLKRAHEERGLQDGHHQSRRRLPRAEDDDENMYGQNAEQGLEELANPQEQMSDIVSPPIQRRQRGAGSLPEGTTRAVHEPENDPSSRSQPQAHGSNFVETFVDEESPPIPAPIAQSALLPNTPSISVYALDIPPQGELDRQYSLRDPMVTAEQYYELTGQQESPETSFQSNGGMPDIPRSVSFAPQEAQDGRRKRETWFRTLSRRFTSGKRKKPEIPPPSVSWYRPRDTAGTTPATIQPTAAPDPAVLVRDFGTQQSAADVASASTRLSQLDIVSPLASKAGPSTDGSSDHSSRVGGRRRRFKDKENALFVINEDPLSRGPSLSNGLDRSLGGEAQQMAVPSFRDPDAESTYSYTDPKLVDAWRRSNASAAANIPQEMNINSRPRGPKRPTHLTIPSPLSPENMLASQVPQSHTLPNQANSLLAVPGTNGIMPRLDRKGTSGTMIGITVEPASPLPSSGLGSGRPEVEFLLSAKHADARSLRSVTVPGGTIFMPDSSAPNPYPPTPKSFSAPLALHQQEKPSRPASVASHPPHPPPKSPSYAPETRILPSSRPQSTQWPTNHSQHRHSASHHTPQSTTRPISNLGNGVIDHEHAPHSRQRHPISNQTPRSATRPLSPQPNGITDNISLHSGRVTPIADRTPRQSYTNLPSTVNEGWAGPGVARSDASGRDHRRVASESVVQQVSGPSHTTHLPTNGAQPLHRVSSNLSMRSNNSQYARYKQEDYLDPAFFPPEENTVKAVDKGKGVDRRPPSPQPSMKSHVSSRLSYVTG